MAMGCGRMTLFGSISARPGRFTAGSSWRDMVAVVGNAIWRVLMDHGVEFWEFG
jgi:hypothetical protein